MVCYLLKDNTIHPRGLKSGLDLEGEILGFIKYKKSVESGAFTTGFINIYKTVRIKLFCNLATILLFYPLYWFLRVLSLSRTSHIFDNQSSKLCYVLSLLTLKIPALCILSRSVHILSLLRVLFECSFLIPQVKFFEYRIPV